MPTLALRNPNQVMRLKRMGAMHQTRLSFVRRLLRQVAREQWQIETSVWDLDDNGYGTVIYDIHATAGERYSLIIFSNELPDYLRTDRVIAQQWDVAFVLFKGVPTGDELAHLRHDVPKQEIGRFSPNVLVLARANKSVRNFNAVVNALANGQQPNADQLAKVGYLYRTTAVYGNGKFGIADFDLVQQTHSFKATFSAQMFAVYLLRHFSIQQAEWLAQQRNPTQAVLMSDPMRRYLGIGNATGLGMAPFLAAHPKLINAWMLARETAIARVIAQPITPQLHSRFQRLLQRATLHVAEIETVHPAQQESNRHLLADLHSLRADFSTGISFASWPALLAHIADCHEETQELINSILIELYPDLVDELAEQMSANENSDLQPEMPLSELIALIKSNCEWALSADFTTQSAQHFFWYQSENKEEPRLGLRHEDAGAERERPLAIARSIAYAFCYAKEFLQTSPNASTIDFLLAHPQQRGIVRRIQSLATAPYGEIRDNLLADDCLPIHMLRCKLSFFGASKFDPRSNLWVRITLFQGAPLLEQLTPNFVDDWNFPTKPTLT